MRKTTSSGLSGRFAVRVSAIQRKVLTNAPRARRTPANFGDMASRLGKASDQVRRTRHGRGA